MERVIYDRMRTLEADHWWFTGRRSVISAVLSDLRLPRNARILEAGCGVGGNIELLRRFGEVSALEPDAPSRAYVEARTGLAPSDGRLPDGLPYAPGSFDAVCAFDVVEHVDDDRGAVAALASLLAPGGRLVVTVPAFQWMWSRHDELHHHKRRYTKAEMVALLADAGLTPVKAGYFNTLLFPLAAAVRVLKRALGVTTEDDRMPPRTINALLHWLFSLERGLAVKGGLPFGLSILAVGQRPA